MKLTLRQEWRLRPLASFLGFLDLKTGVVVALLFALLNKVAGVYGLIALLTGAGGSAAQLSQYIYSVFGLICLAWGLKAVEDEDPKRTLYFAHYFFADHIVSTAWTIFFAVHWWVYTPHDGRRIANSPAQQALIDGYIGQHQNVTEAERIIAAEDIWGREKGVAATIIILGWLSKFYLAALLYSFAHHLRRGTYRSLPLSRSTVLSSLAYTAARPEPDDDSFDEETDAFYSPASATTPLPLYAHHQQNHGRRPGSNGSFADFVGAPTSTEAAARELTRSWCEWERAWVRWGWGSGEWEWGGVRATMRSCSTRRRQDPCPVEVGRGEKDRVSLMDGKAPGSARGGTGNGARTVVVPLLV
ncbi:hypothetical protein EW146_g2865 [Bondarzewia mesenterica]|uniref:DUF1753-domain-containing protein n=1 Tax=Bondarzewia mesenterica TaxID=1095465 RepID=A0A4S4LZT9_9AGAM|nr:hypothetical protein EW146_g2865 [Bondarzewia mesenterica]